MAVWGCLHLLSLFLSFSFYIFFFGERAEFIEEIKSLLLSYSHILRKSAVFFFSLEFHLGMLN